MNTRDSRSLLRALVLSALVALLMTVSSVSARAEGTTDAELRGYKGGLVEIGLSNGTTVRGLLYAYTSEHLELEVAKEATAKVHRSRVKWLKAAPAGASKSLLGAFPADAAMPSSGAPPRAAVTPATPPPRETPTPTSAAPRAPDTPGGATVVGNARGPKAKGVVFELKLGGTLYSPSLPTELHPSTPVSADAMIGYKFGRYVLGARIDFAMGSIGSGDDTYRLSMLIIAPTFQVTLMDSWPLSIYGTLSIDFGPAIESGGGGDTGTLPVLGFRAGAGIRYFAHPRFAVGAEAGFRGLWFLEKDYDIGLLTIYGQASLFFIW